MAAAAASSSSGPITKAASAQEPPIIGFEKDKAKIIDAMLDPNHPELSFIVIEGGMGVGKTTLAKEIYASAAVQQDFDVHIWCFEEFNILEEIRTQIIGIDSHSRIEGGGEGQSEPAWKIAEEVREYLSGKRYCLVIDHCSLGFFQNSIPKWDVISGALPDNKKGSRVLLIYSYLLNTPQLLMRHIVEPRSEDESLEILIRAANLNLNLNLPTTNTMQSMLDLARQSFLPFCGGLPWLLRFMGSLLAMSPPNPQSWDQLLRTITRKYPDFQRVLAMKSRLMLSHSVRAAFLSFLTYPPDAHIPAHALLRKWTALRIAQDDAEANQMLQKFVEWSIVQVLEAWPINGRLVKVCQMVNPLVRALAVQEAREKIYVRVCSNHQGVIYRDIFCPDALVDNHMVKKGDNFNAEKIDVRQLVDSTCGIFNWSSETKIMLSWSRALEVNSSQNIRDVERALMEMERPRYLELRNSGLLHEITNIVGLLDHLETLVVEDTPLEILPPGLLSQNIPLKHLTLSGTKLKEIPLSVHNLKLLETLDIRDTFIRSLPHSVWTLTNLRSVLASDSFEHLDGPPNSSQRSNLETLTIVHISETWKKNAVPKLYFLRELGLSSYNRARICKLENNWHPAFNLLGTLKNLSSLKLQGSHIPARIIHVNTCPSYSATLTELWVGGSQSPFSLHDITMPPWLTNLTLENLEFEEDPMPVLGKLEELKILQLRWLLLGAAPAARKISCSSDLFPCLEMLELYRLIDLDEWSVEEGAMPKLTHVLIRKCKALKSLPHALLQRQTPLQELHMHSMPSAFTEHVSQLPFVKITNNLN